jgi:hypothetical protein
LELRQARLLTLKTGTIRFSDGSCDVACAIFDHSSTGACILVPEAAKLPQTFGLMIDEGGSRHACERAWSSGHKIGVWFQAAAAN